MLLTPALPANRHTWTFLSNHAHVLIAVAQDPGVRVRDLASAVGITERTVLQILADLEDAGAILRQRIGRRTHYEIDASAALRHPLESHRTVGDLVGIVAPVVAGTSNLASRSPL
jgi:DNA-binding transcriptional ArsR family regulator